MRMAGWFLAWVSKMSMRLPRSSAQSCADLSNREPMPRRLFSDATTRSVIHATVAALCSATQT